MGCFGNNMAVRAEAVRTVGGFSRIGYAVTEDAALLAAVSATRKWRIRVCTSAETAVMTRPKSTWGSYINQHARWNAGAFFSRDPVTRLGYSFIVFYLMACILSLPFGLLDSTIALLGLNAFLCIGVLGFLGGLYPDRRPGAASRRARYYITFIPYLIFFGFFYSYVSLRALRGKPLEWKGAIVRASGKKKP